MSTYSVNRMRRPVQGKNKLFDSGEHMFIGNHIELSVPDGSKASQRTADTYPLQLPNGLKLTYGVISALGGDFYGFPDTPISTSSDPKSTFVGAFNTLASASAALTEAPGIIQIIKKEIQDVEAGVKSGLSYYDAYSRIDNDGDFNVATGGGSVMSKMLPEGRYLKLAETNLDHFGKHAIVTYVAGHTSALQLAVSADGDEGKLQLAYAMNAFADHFLADMFSAGHMRTPRAELHAAGVHSYVPTVTFDLLAKYMHDEESYWGLQVKNQGGDAWTAFGDKMLFEGIDQQNETRVIAAVQASADEIYQGFLTKKVPGQESFKALSLAPDMAAISADRGAPNKSPLFVIDPSGNLLRRTIVEDVNSYNWTDDWTAAGSVLLLEQSEGSRMPHRPDSTSVSLRG